MKLAFTYVVLTPGTGVPPDKKLDAAMQPLTDQVATIASNTVDRIRLRLIVEDVPTEPVKIERRGREVVIHCFVDFEEYKRLKLSEKAEYLRVVAKNAVERFLHEERSAVN